LGLSLFSNLFYDSLIDLSVLDSHLTSDMVYDFVSLSSVFFHDISKSLTLSFLSGLLLGLSLQIVSNSLGVIESSLQTSLSLLEAITLRGYVSLLEGVNGHELKVIKHAFE
jgi:hypothetical protein